MRDNPRSRIRRPLLPLARTFRDARARARARYRCHTRDVTGIPGGPEDLNLHRSHRSIVAERRIMARGWNKIKNRA